MSRPPKPFTVITSEKKSHRTKAELQQRKKGEEKLLTGRPIKPAPGIWQNPVARAEYLRVKQLLESIDKNDDLYGAVISRYCFLHSECRELEKRREYFFELIQKLESSFEEATEDFDCDSKCDNLVKFSREIARLTAGMMKIDSMIQQKRKMLLDIEKENVMTVASALRSVPKQPDKEENPLLKLLRDG